MRKIQDLGVYVVPYINGRLFDYNAPSWSEESLSAATKTMAPRFCPMSLQPVVDTYGSKQNLAIMCPYTRYWQDRVVEMVRKVYEYGADGVYLDQVSASKAIACADETHHHSVRGGNYWHEGYLDMVQSCNHVAQQYKKALVTGTF